MANQIERDVYVLQNAYQQPIPYVRFTNAIPIVFNFRDYDIPEDSTVKAFCAKPSGAAVYSDAVLSGNTVTINVTDQMFIELGETILQVQVLNGDSTLVTFGWPVIVQPNATEGDIPPSQNESGFWNELQQQVDDAVNNCNEAAASVNTAISNAEQATQTANNAAANANEAAQQVFDQQYILTTDYTFPESGTVQPTSYGNAIVQEIDGAIYQGADPSPDNPQFIHGVGDTGFFDGELLNGYYNISNGLFVESNGSVCSANKIPCKEGDIIELSYVKKSGLIITFFREDDTILGTNGYAVDSISVKQTAPKETSYCRISVSPKDGDNTKHITVTFNGNYAVILDTVGKNLFNKNDVQAGKYVSDTTGQERNLSGCNLSNYIDIKGNEYIYATQVSNYSYMAFYSSSYVFISGSNRYGAISVPENACYAKFSVLDEFMDSFMVVSGNEATDYLPYQSSRTYIPISSPLYSSDRIYQQSGQYRVSRQWGVAVFDGSEDENWSFDTSKNNLAYTTLNNSNNLYTNNNAKCNVFAYNTSVYLAGGNEVGFIVNGATFYARFSSESEVNSLSALKIWLQSNPITVVYQLATPTDEPLSQAGIIAAYSLMACDEVTNVSLTGADPNLTLNNIVKFPRNSDGALLTTTRANGVMIELKDQNEDLTTITQQIATLNQFMASFDGKTLYTT